MQEICAAKRAALVAQLTAEQEAALAQVRDKAKAEAKGRIDRASAPVRDRNRDEQEGLHNARRTAQRCTMQRRARPIRFKAYTGHHR